MNFLDGLKNFLQLISDNWVLILTIIGLLIGLYKKMKDYLAKSNDERIEIAMSAIRETMLKFVSDAEKNYSDMSKSGQIKRAEVIDQLYKDYPILSKAVDQQRLIELIDEAIDEALPALREIIKKNSQEG